MGKSNEMFISIQEELINTANLVEEGELSHLDGLIKMRDAKKEAEKVLEIVKSFEDENINEIAHEAQQYDNLYCGFEIKSVNGRKSFNFKGIEEIEEVEQKKKELQKQYESAFDGIVKGVVQTTEVDGVKYWIDVNGELKRIPELSIGKSYLLVKEKRNK